MLTSLIPNVCRVGPVTLNIPQGVLQTSWHCAPWSRIQFFTFNLWFECQLAADLGDAASPDPIPFIFLHSWENLPNYWLMPPSEKPGPAIVNYFIYSFLFNALTFHCYYRLQTKLRKGNVFTPACQLNCSRGVCMAGMWAWWGACMMGGVHWWRCMHGVGGGV